MDKKYSVTTADPGGYWLIPDGINDPAKWACMKSADPVEEIEDLRAKLDAAEAASGAYLTFMLTELDWKWFRAETFGDTASEQNAKKLRDWLVENGDPGPAFLERITAAEEDKERLIRAINHTLTVFNNGGGMGHEMVRLRAAIDGAREKQND